MSDHSMLPDDKWLVRLHTWARRGAIVAAVLALITLLLDVGPLRSAGVAPDDTLPAGSGAVPPVAHGYAHRSAPSASGAPVPPPAKVAASAEFSGSSVSRPGIPVPGEGPEYAGAAAGSPAGSAIDDAGSQGHGAGVGAPGMASGGSGGAVSGGRPASAGSGAAFGGGGGFGSAGASAPGGAGSASGAAGDGGEPGAESGSGDRGSRWETAVEEKLVWSAGTEAGPAPGGGGDGTDPAAGAPPGNDSDGDSGGGAAGSGPGGGGNGDGDGGAGGTGDGQAGPGGQGGTSPGDDAGPLGLGSLGVPDPDSPGQSEPPPYDGSEHIDATNQRVAQVPEPATLLLVTGGLAGALARRRRR